MSVGIVYFSKSGTTKRIAEQTAAKLGMKPIELKDNINWKGFIGFMKGGFYAMKDKHVEITFDNTCLSCDEFIVMSPLWAGGPAPAAREFIRRVGADKVDLLLTNDGSDVTIAFNRTRKLFPKLKKTYGITKKLKNKEIIIEEIVKTYTKL